MPIFEFNCLCTRFEKHLRSAEERDIKLAEGQIECPICEESRYVVKAPPRTAPPKFKGSGFHVTDYS